MTDKELNKKIRDLKNYFHAYYEGGMYTDETEKHEKYIKQEIRDCYGADITMKSLTAESILTLIRLNNQFRAIQFHTFGLFIKL